jgi:N,N'-diacetyllegionaminate synthase
LKKKVFISTGMCTLKEIDDAIQVLEKAGTKRSMMTVLQCTTAYPAPMSEVNLRAMDTIQKAFGVKVGYSDHTSGIEAAIAAVALGAEVVEKHFTLNRNLPGPDHLASLEPAELKSMVLAIRNIECALGDGFKAPSPSETKNMSVVRKSIVAKKTIKMGDVFTVNNLAVKRPGYGLSPMLWKEVLGKKAIRDFNIDELINL